MSDSCENNCLKCKYLICEKSFLGRIDIKCQKGYGIDIKPKEKEKEEKNLKDFELYKSADLLGISVHELLDNYSFIMDGPNIVGFANNYDLETLKRKNKQSLFGLSYGVCSYSLKDVFNFKVLTYDFLQFLNDKDR